MMINHCRPQPCRCIAVILLLSVAHLAQARPPPQARRRPPPPPPAAPAAPKPIHHIYFDPRTRTFNSLRTELSALLLASSTPAYDPTNVRQRYVLGPRREDFYDEPPGWIYIHVTVGDGPHDIVILNIAIDDLYLFGFSNGTGHQYKFSGGKSKEHKSFPDGIVLPITENYGQLIADGHKMLYKVPLGKKSAIHAGKQLSTYDPATSPVSQLQDSLLRYIVMICEGMRFRNIWETFSGDNNWEKETFLDETQAKSVVDWGSLSMLLIRWELTRRLGDAKWGQTDGYYGVLAKKVSDNIKVAGADDAVNIVEFLLRPKTPVPTYIDDNQYTNK